MYRYAHTLPSAHPLLFGADLALALLGRDLEEGAGKEHQRHFQRADQQQEEGRRYQRKFNQRAAALVAQQGTTERAQQSPCRREPSAQKARGLRQAGTTYPVESGTAEHRIPLVGGSPRPRAPRESLSH